MLIGTTITESLAARVAEACFADASALPHNAYKIDQGQGLVKQALLSLL
jgi:hypothetical protein